MAQNKAAKPATKSAMIQSLADASQLTRKQVTGLFDALSEYIKAQLGKKGPGVVNMVGLLKIKRVMKPAAAERQGRNPATGEPMTFKAKPARTVVKSQPLKTLKDFVK
jgi:nucleoid DNA-binding protein